MGRNKEKRFLGVYNAIITEKHGAESELIFFLVIRRSALAAGAILQTLRKFDQQTFKKSLTKNASQKACQTTFLPKVKTLTKNISKGFSFSTGFLL